MRHYPTNSPKAAARVLIMMLISNARLEHAELDFLQKLRVAEKLGLSEESFTQVLQDYCADLLADPRRATVQTAAPALVDGLLDEITDPHLQQQIADFAFLLSHADDQFCQIEQAVYQRMLQRWRMDLSGTAVFTTDSIKLLGQIRQAARQHTKQVVQRLNREIKPVKPSATTL
ncbi:hypothetical protein [Parvibium lacunae]|uniref:TerB family tellurite resistance protein n=1 Tax=Parvibium lacunae TaxID=1888893 RepID=A0A368L0X5_9BURK|nr:hypothetical protein [Parvibium lacunae]RCS56749.1 hypothetical protein DU000_10380 [Parvibium lacunae]